MKITIRLPDEIGKQIHQMPNPDEFVSNLVKEALKNQPGQKTSSDPKLSKWARISHRVRSNPFRIGEYTHHLEKDMKEFRENFEFRYGGKFYSLRGSAS